MQKHYRFICIMLMVMGFCFMQGMTASAASYPEKSIQLIVPYGPGGGVDLMARTIDLYAKDVFGHNFTIIHKPGAGGAVGTTSMARAKPDGYTIGLGTLPNLILQPASGSGQYTTDSFDYLAVVAGEAQLLVTHKNSPYETYAQLKEAGQKNPKKLTVGHLLLNEGWVAYNLLDKLDNWDFTSIIYQGGADLTAALLGEQIDAAIVNLGTVYGELDSVRVLGITGAERSSFIPNVPTFKELGVDMESYFERVFIAPKGLKPEHLQVLREGFKKIWNNPEFQKRCADMRYGVKWVSGEDVKAHVDAQAKPVLEIYKSFQESAKK